MLFGLDLYEPRNARSTLAADPEWRASLERWIVHLRERPNESPKFFARGAAALELLINPERPVLGPDEVRELYDLLRDALWGCVMREADTWHGRDEYARRRRREWATWAIALRLYLSSREIEEVR